MGTPTLRVRKVGRGSRGDSEGAAGEGEEMPTKCGVQKLEGESVPRGEHHQPPYMLLRGQVRQRLRTHHWIDNVGSLGAW